MGGHGSKEHFEFDSESGVEVNTRILRDLYGWTAHLLDGSLENPDIPLHKDFFTPSNIVSLLQKYEVSKHLDVLGENTTRRKEKATKKRSKNITSFTFLDPGRDGR
jgi:hypothetical protein